MNGIEELIRSGLSADGLAELFQAHLGWDRPDIATFTVGLEGETFTVLPLAQKRGLHVFEIRGDDLPPAAAQAAIDREISKRSFERILVFSTRTRQVWRWPEARPSGGVRLVPHEYRVASPNENLVQRIAKLRFTPAEESRLTLHEVRARVRLSLNAEQVTKRFYDAFRGCHGDLLGGIEGIVDEDERSWYASLLMNRLMFIYFLQMKGFIGGDQDFLRTCLASVRRLRGTDEFYGFYRDLLVPMFHDGFGSSDHAYADADIAAILSHVPYLNGGIFERHPLEERYEIRIRDDYFERIFDFFDSFTWHLDTSPSGDPNQINPDVLGYVFEQYINLTASGKRENGAYYTKDDVTTFMVEASVAALVLERLIDQIGVNPFIYVQSDPLRYMPEPWLHGYDRTVGEWTPLPAVVASSQDVGQWGALDTIPSDPAVQLLGETWVETLARRDRVEQVQARIEAAEINDATSAVDARLDIRALVVDGIRGISSPEQLVGAWSCVSGLTIIDPTCGSGAFLFAALRLLDEIYEAILETAEAHVESGNPEAVTTLRVMTEERREHENLAYWRLKHAALSNLYGLDIMAEAVEIAKLRLFLTLAARLDSPSEIEPLPDLDFNLRAGNLLVGFYDLDDAESRVGGDLLSLEAVKALVPRAHELTTARTAFVAAVEGNAPSAEVARLKSELEEATADVRSAANTAYADAVGAADHHEWLERAKPFHWFVEMPHIVERGGFDAVIGNPPYIRGSALAALPYEIVGYRTAGTPDVYAVCLERSLVLLAPRGWLSLITMVSLAFSQQFAIARELLRVGSRVWVASFGKRPDSLFFGVQVRNAIILAHRGGSGLLASRHHLWPREARPTRLPLVEFGEIDNENLSAAMPRAGRAAGVVNRILALPRRPLTFGPATNGHCVVYRHVAAYWFPAMPFRLPILNSDFTLASNHEDAQLKAIPCATRDDALLVFGLLAGKVAYLWWAAWGDDLNVTSEVTLDLVERVLPVIRGDAELLERAEESRAAALDAVLYTKNAGKRYGNVRWPGLRAVTDGFDQLLLERLGIPQEWGGLNIWYRQAMRAGGVPGNARLITRSEASRILDEAAATFLF